MFRGGLNAAAAAVASQAPLLLTEAGGSTGARAAAAVAAAPAAAVVEDDVVTDEVKRWSLLSQDKVNEFIDGATGMLNEFALMYDVRALFPLHYLVFRQVSAHIAHPTHPTPG